MRALWLFSLCLVGAGLTSAQDAASNQVPPAVEVLKLKWSQEIQSPWLEDSATYSATKSLLPESSRANNAINGGSTISPDSPFPPGGRLPVYYAYSVKIKNGGAKAIRGVAWEYLFADPDSSQELGRHQFVSFEQVAANESATLHGKSSSPPVAVVSAQALKRDKRAPFLERVEFKCVLYADGTLWRHPAEQGDACDYLSRGVNKQRQ